MTAAMYSGTTVQAGAYDTLDELMQGFVDDGEILGGSLIVRKDGTVVFQNCWGYADFARQRPASESDIYRIYSMTKPVTAAAITP